MGTTPSLPEETPSLRAHKRQRLWQIWLPMIALTVLILAAALLVTLGGAGQTRLWSDISLIWLMLPLLAFGLVGLGLSGLAIYGMARLLRATPRLTGKLQFFAGQANVGTRRLSDKAVQPFIWIRAAGAAVRSAWHFLFGHRR
ncbi:MAG: hypothetical protein N2049_04070 [Anaerolineales bacterium]|nr:hypothetical protein [Anaerolineales bacterium]MCX7608379.1 hypothetical protein [Anaerolineales bacterium]MDW8227767.1 hypothetical protein [Anaerolineales bacterium]